MDTVNQHNHALKLTGTYTVAGYMRAQQRHSLLLSVWLLLAVLTAVVLANYQIATPTLDDARASIAIDKITTLSRIATLNVPKEAPQEQKSISNAELIATAQWQDQLLLTSQLHYIANIVSNTKNRSVDPYEIAFEIMAQSREAKFDPLLVTSIVFAESSFRKSARSPVGAVGLMQLMPNTARYISHRTEVKWHGTGRLTEPAYNVKLGLAYLKYLLDRFDGDLHLALIAYNWGPANLRTALRSHEKPIPSVCKRYSKQIQKNYQQWKDDFNSRLPYYQALVLNLETLDS